MHEEQVRRAVWPWRDEEQPPVQTGPPYGRLLAIAGIAALFWWLGWLVPLLILMVVSSGLGAYVLLSPEHGRRRLQNLEAATAKGIAALLNLLLLGPVFVLFFVPFSLLLRRGGGRLDMAIDKQRESYWVVREPQTKAERFERLS